MLSSKSQITETYATTKLSEERDRCKEPLRVFVAGNHMPREPRPALDVTGLFGWKIFNNVSILFYTRIKLRKKIIYIYILYIYGYVSYNIFVCCRMLWYGAGLFRRGCGAPMTRSLTL